MSKLENIILGHIDEVFNNNADLSKARLQICKDCPLMTDTVFGKVCNSKIYMEPKTKKISYKYLAGYFKGCGCRLDAKTRRHNESCPAKLW